MITKKSKKAKKRIKYNLFQQTALAYRKKTTFCNAGRGAGKSTGLARHMLDLVFGMPRSRLALGGESYRAILDNTLPSTIHGLEQHGLYLDYHYVIGRRPPKAWDWPAPYQPPMKAANTIWFYNGTVVQLVSQDSGASSGVGTNLDGIMTDEHAKLDPEKLANEMLANMRGSNRVAFRDHPLFCSSFFISSAPLTPAGEHIYDYEQLALEKPDEYLFIKAPSHVNYENLGAAWFGRQRERMEDWQYQVEINNRRRKSVRNGFYPLLDETYHGYHHRFAFEKSKSLVEDKALKCEGDGDRVDSKPLIIGQDFGASINCMVVAQENLGGLYFLKDFHVLSPDILDDVIDMFCDYYEGHGKRVIEYHCDPAGNHRRADNPLPLADQAIQRLKAKGWTVIKKTRHMLNVLHTSKFRLWSTLLKEEDPSLPVIRFNRHNCQNLIVSMSNAAAKSTSREEVKKVKASERNKSLNQAHATHLSDAADFIVSDRYMRKLKLTPTYMPPSM